MKNQYASTTLTINLQAIRDNYNILKSKAKAAKVSAVVKANAYGLGVAEIATTLANEGCEIFFVANLDEAIELRGILPNVTIFILHGVEAGQEEALTQHKLIPTINSIYQINIWQQHAEKKQIVLPCILNFDTGMNRLGLRVKETSSLVPYPLSINPVYVMSHLACSDEKSNPKNIAQLEEFKSIAKNYKNIPLSFANSGGIFLGPDYHFDLVRPGVALYGVNPTTLRKNPMKNVIKLTSRMLQIERIDRAGTVGYGAEYKIERGAKVATIAVGYADGYLRSLSNKAICAIDGIIVPVIGRISMDLITVDVTKIPEDVLSSGTEIELIGDNITVDAVASAAGTIGYEILTSLGARYKRIYK